MKKTQTELVINELLKRGKVSRNWALHNYITRLGAIIANLVNEGWKFDSIQSKGEETMHGRYVKGKYGRDYVYYLVTKK